MNEVYDVALAIYKEVFDLLGNDKMWVHYDQTFRAVSSIVANIAEGEGSRWGREGYTMTRMINARGSLYETLAWLDIALVEKQAKQEEIEGIKAGLVELDIILKEALEEVSDRRDNLAPSTATKRISSYEYWTEKARERKGEQK